MPWALPDHSLVRQRDLPKHGAVRRDPPEPAGPVGVLSQHKFSPHVRHREEHAVPGGHQLAPGGAVQWDCYHPAVSRPLVGDRHEVFANHGSPEVPGGITQERYPVGAVFEVAQVVRPG
jgi:hypothetical protein